MRELTADEIMAIIADLGPHGQRVARLEAALRRIIEKDTYKFGPGDVPTIGGFARIARDALNA